MYAIEVANPSYSEEAKRFPFCLMQRLQDPPKQERHVGNMWAERNSMAATGTIRIHIAILEGGETGMSRTEEERYRNIVEACRKSAEHDREIGFTRLTPQESDALIDIRLEAAAKEWDRAGDALCCI